jgi:putative tributyrin esterase
MATGKMRYYSIAQAGQVEFCFVLPNDIPAEMTTGNPNFDRPAKTLYLLHGYSGNESDWEYNGIAEDLAARFNLNIIMITAGNNFYLDREATGRKYCTFAGQEIIDYTRRIFGLSAKREDTIIAGLSMGGFGAIHTGLSYPNTFGGVIALSSALIVHDVAKMKNGEEPLDGAANLAYYQEVFGDPNKVLDSDVNPERLYEKLEDGNKQIPPIYLAIGTEDFLYQNNQDFRKFLESHHADMKYEEGPGIHDWKFWNEYIVRGLTWILKRIGE